MWEAEQEQHTHSTDPKSKARRVSAGKGGLSQAHPAWAGNFLVPTSTCDSEKTQPWSEPETSNCQMRGSLTRVLLPKAAHDSQKEITTPSVTAAGLGIDSSVTKPTPGQRTQTALHALSAPTCRHCGHCSTSADSFYLCRALECLPCPSLPMPNPNPSFLPRVLGLSARAQGPLVPDALVQGSPCLPSSRCLPDAARNNSSILIRISLRRKKQSRGPHKQQALKLNWSEGLGGQGFPKKQCCVTSCGHRPHWAGAGGGIFPKPMSPHVTCSLRLSVAGRLAPWNWQKPVVKPVPADHHGSSRGCPESRGASPRKDAPTQRHTTLRAMSGRSQSPETLSWNPQTKDPHSKAFQCFSQEKGGKNGHMSQKPSQRFEMFYCQTSFNVWKHDCAAIVQMRTLEAQTGYVSCLNRVDMR